MRNFSSMDDEIRRQSAERIAENKKVTQATLLTAEHTKETAKEVIQLNSKVEKLSKDLETERKKNELENESNKHEQKVAKLENDISEYRGRRNNTFASLFGFAVMIYIFFYENLKLTTATIICLIIAVSLYHGVSLAYYIRKIFTLKSDLILAKQDKTNS